MRWPGRKPIQIKISRALVHMAVEDAATTAARTEMERQIREQYPYDASIDVTGADITMTMHQYPTIPDSDTMTFEWTD